jgi:hypothetical protein
LFETLQELYPRQYDDKLRTVQRRVAHWKAKHGKPKEVMFKIQHPPGIARQLYRPNDDYIAQLARAFMEWAKPYIDDDESRWFAIDGKGLNGSITAPREAHQQFVNLVSVFSQSQGIVVALEHYRSNQGSEIEVVETLIAALDLQAVTYTMDAAHCQKNGQDNYRAGQ